tara:strand:+ start:1490 stop:1912 length:423 start_codon:yes stop_codon:yes gene_type:complete
MILRNIFLILIILFFPNLLLANTKYYQDALNFYKDKKFNKAKFKFEQDLVYNPKNEMSYLYLSKIFKKLKNKDLQEKNLNTVILLNPQNEEAIYNLAKLKLDSSDYSKSKELNDKLAKLCSKFCGESLKLKKEIENLSKK